MPRNRRISLPEPVEHIGEKFRANTDSRILNDDLDVRIDAFQDDLDAAIGGGELHGIRQ